MEATIEQPVVAASFDSIIRNLVAAFTEDLQTKDHDPLES